MIVSYQSISRLTLSQSLQRLCLNSLKINKGGLQIIDIDWVASDKTIALYEDGCMRILDASLNTATSPIPLNDSLPCEY